jgi:hypothetical protein
MSKLKFEVKLDNKTVAFQYLPECGPWPTELRKPGLLFHGGRKYFHILSSFDPGCNGYSAIWVPGLDPTFDHQIVTMQFKNSEQARLTYNKIVRTLRAWSRA